MTDYTTVSALKGYLRISGTGDDALLGDLVTRASRMIDDHCGRWFSAETQTRYYDAVGAHITGQLLFLDADLLSVTTLVNGDGTEVSSDDYILRPVNWPPYFGIALKTSSGLGWTYTDSPEKAIRVTGTWGYSATPPEPIVHATIRLAAWLYRQRDTGAEPSQVEVSERGVSIAPARLPRDVLDLIGPYVRLRLSTW
ncbi:MAG TPA: hypothetical protein ENI95_09075 [Chloroflexi bacterium]|nr:hypothetical protein [Chloroflexota bacterium]